MKTQKLNYVISFIITLLLAGCANAGPDQIVNSYSTVILDGSESNASVGGEIAQYRWRQVSGPIVELDNPSSQSSSFITPNVETETILEFKLQTTEEGGHPSTYVSYDSIRITVQPSSGLVDTIPPVITLNGNNNISLELGETYVESGATAIDNIDGNVAVNITGTVDTNTEGTYTITYSATDASANIATLERTILVISSEVNDTTPPVITLNGKDNITLSIGDAYVEAGATATDNKDGDVDVNITGTVDINAEGTYTITYTATDASGNIATLERTVLVTSSEVNDTTPPVITLNGEDNITLSIGDAYVELGATAIDNKDGNVDVNISGTVDTNISGIYTITYTAIDEAGNSASIERNIIVESIDITPPVITLNGDTNITLELGETYVELGATAIDNSDGDVDINITGTVDINTEGNYTITYSAIDEAGNSASIERNITVINNIDVTPPVITLNGDTNITLELGETYIELGATALDDRDGNVDVNISGTVDTNSSGRYTITYTAVDTTGNIETIRRNITVIGTHPDNGISIENGERTQNILEGGYNRFNVTLSETTNAPRVFAFHTEDITATAGTIEGGGDYISIPLFSDESIIFDSNNSTIIVPAGTGSFSVFIETLTDDSRENVESYKFFLDEAYATGSMHDPRNN